MDPTTSIQFDATAAWLTIAVLSSCVICLALLFLYSGRIRSFGLHRKLLLDSVYNQEKQQQYWRIEKVQYKKSKIEGDIELLRRKLDQAQDTSTKQDLEDRLEQKQQELEEIDDEIQQTEVEIDKEASQFAKSVIPPDVSISEEYGPALYLEFGTVIVIIFAVLSLAVLGVLGGQETSTILAAIAGYVLGKATKRPAPSALER